MASKEQHNDPQDAKGRHASPEWANGLRQLYDSVVDEPIPDSFKDLLAQFDADDADNRSDPSPPIGEGGVA